jgi:cation diffusion facilitator CzcD-associated flavoprotein CzcO
MISASSGSRVVIIGAGVHGASTAYYLTLLGEKPLIIERSEGMQRVDALLIKGEYYSRILCSCRCCLREGWRFSCQGMGIRRYDSIASKIFRFAQRAREGIEY